MNDEIITVGAEAPPEWPCIANARWFEEVADRHIAAAAATLPSEVAIAAQERGKARDLWATTAELLTELEKDEPDELDKNGFLRVHKSLGVNF